MNANTNHTPALSIELAAVAYSRLGKVGLYDMRLTLARLLKTISQRELDALQEHGFAFTEPMASEGGRLVTMIRLAA